MRKTNSGGITRWSQVLFLGVALTLNHFGTAAAGPVMSTQTIEIPDVVMVRSDGQQISLRHELDDGRPVVLNFVFTSCPGICPVMSQVFSQLQRALGAERGHVHLVSISIDPEQDTPARLREYAGKFGAGSQWQHYTGTVEASQSVQRAFGVYNGDKMSHSPVTFMRGAPGQHWQRIDGLASGADLLNDYNLLGSRHSSAH
jgi:protein SCO1/2